MKRKHRPGSDEQKRRSSAQYRTLVGKWLGKLAANYRVELTDKETALFLEYLVSWTDYQINAAFDRCLVECLFFPKLAEVLERMPEDRAPRFAQLCARCAPDGWVTVPSPTNPGYNVAVRCDHVTNYPPPNDIKPLYKDLPSSFTAPTKPAPRFPHLVGKGIMYGK